MLFKITKTKYNNTMKKETYIINAAGGNATAIQVLEIAKTREEYETLGRALITDNQDKNVEQAGFLILADNHFEMSGGEFCGNAARAVAILISQRNKKEEVEFSMSGFDGRVKGSVKTVDKQYYDVTCRFPGMALVAEDVNIGGPAILVDMGGIVHVLIEDVFPRHSYTAIHREITQQLKLEQRDAVGVVWVRRFDGRMKIDPVVWVRSIDSFFYESSCGSGSIAAAKGFGIGTVMQPTGEDILVDVKENEVIIQSKMEVIDERKD